MPFDSRRQAEYLSKTNPKLAAEKGQGTDWENLPDSAADRKARGAVAEKLKKIAEREE